ncbi:MAG: hypothetical protein AAFX39_04255 [Pseudomonadota bacterium]
MTIIVHFGMQKTASSSIQRTFHKIGAWDDCRYLAYSHSQANGLVTFREQADLDTFATEVDRVFIAPIREADAKTYIISSENFPFLDRDALTVLFTRLQDTGHDVRAVGYIRRPKSFMESIFQERLKKRHMKRKDLPRTHPHYRRKFSRFEHLRKNLGVDVAYWLYDPNTMAERCIVRDFCAKTGLSINPSLIDNSNVGLSLPAIKLLFVYRKHLARSGKKVIATRERAMVARLGALNGPKFRFHSRLAGPILKDFKSDTIWMQERLGTSLSEDIEAGDDQALLKFSDLNSINQEALDWLWSETAQKQDDDATPTDEASPDQIVERMMRLQVRHAA